MVSHVLIRVVGTTLVCPEVVTYAELSGSSVVDSYLRLGHAHSFGVRWLINFGHEVFQRVLVASRSWRADASLDHNDWLMTWLLEQPVHEFHLP